MAWQDAPFPDRVMQGAQREIRRAADIVTSRSGREHRNVAWANGRRLFRFSVPPKDAAAIQALLDHWEGRRGVLHSFPLRDWADWKSVPIDQTPTPTDQPLGTGDGSTTDFQLVKVYEAGGTNPYTRKILHPVVSSVRVALDGTEQMSGWTVSRSTGIVSFSTAPLAGVAVTAGFEYDIAVRYQSDSLRADFLVDELADWSVELIEVFE